MSSLAAIRPDSWDLPLFLHVLGAFVMVGAAVLAAAFLVPAWRNASVDALRVGYRSLLYGALPGFVVMRVAAQWLYDEEGIGDIPDEPAWTAIGFGTSDLGALLLVIATVITRWGCAARTPGAPGSPRRSSARCSCSTSSRSGR